MQNIRFYLQADNNERWQAYPSYKDGLSIDYEMESGQQFFRKKLSDKLTFMSEDYTRIMSYPFDSEYHVFIEQKVGSTWNNLCSMKFHITDCSINEDDQTITAQLDPLDDYTDILDGWEKEFNIVKLLPEIQRCNVLKRPLLQFYCKGDDKVTNYLGGMKWEQDAESTDDEGLIYNRYHFSRDAICKEVRVYGDGLPEASGVYIAKLQQNEQTNLFDAKLTRFEDNTYYLHLLYTQGTTSGRLAATLCRTSDNVILYSWQATVKKLEEGTLNMVAVSPMTGTMQADMTTRTIFSRLLLDVEKYDGTNTYKIAQEDIVENNRNYHYCIGVSFSATEIYNGYQTSPTEYGLINDDRYFIPPTAQEGEKFFPIAQSRWRNASLWLAYHNVPTDIDAKGVKNYTLRDTYPVASCIRKLLEEITQSVTHEATPTYSQFLYGDVNPMSGYFFRLLLTPKSNVVAGEYTQAAQKGQITLKGILDMLKNVFQCYWYVENGALKIEHIQFFKNGGAYEDTHVIGFDLTQMKNVRNGKVWAWGKSEYSFDRIDMPETYTFKWMDDCTLGFEGKPIEVLSRVVQKGKKEEINVANFTADIDYMLTMPNEVSKDGFALLAGTGATLFYNNPLSITIPRGEFSAAFKTKVMDAEYQFTMQFLATKLGDADSRLRVHYYDADDEEIWYNAVNLDTSSSLQTITFEVPRGTYAIRFYCPTGSGVRLSVYSAQTNNVLQLPMINAYVDGVNMVLQNGYCAFVEAQPKYWLYDMPTYRVKVNGSETLAYSVSQKKKQNVNIPTDLIMPNDDLSRNLIKTFIGDGKIEKISLNLSSGLAKTTLKYDSEQQP